MSGRWPALVQGPVLCLAACLALLVGGLIELSSLHYSSPVALATASCAACILAPLLGRSHPAASALLAGYAIAAYQALTDDPNGGFVVGATLMAFYYLGRDHPGTASVRRVAAVDIVALPAVVFAAVSSHDAAVAAVGQWAVLVVLPTVVGRAAERRQRLVSHLAQAAEELRRDQLRAAGDAATLERARVARELHDVVAHYVSVMVIQAGAARTVCMTNPDASRTALEAVETAGRRALDELRRVLGALRRDPDGATSSAVDASQIAELCQSVAAAGVSATLTTSDIAGLAVESSQAVYRIVQEALTNVARYAPGAHVEVVIRRCDNAVEVTVTDDGGEAKRGGRSVPSGGHGLVGMAERAAWVGGTLQAGSRAGGGFEVMARLPRQPQAVRQPNDTSGTTWVPAAARRRIWPVLQRWLDPAMAAGFAVILAIDAGLHAAGSARVPCIVLAFTLGAAVGWRRSRPLAYVTATLALTGAVTVVSASLAAGPLFGAFVLVVPTYTVAASLPQRRAAIGLAIWTAGATLHAVLGHISPSRLAGSLVAAAVVFAVGRLSRAQRALAAELEARNAELAAQRDSRAHVAVLAERNRIARDLHLLIAQTITAMVVQAAAAKELVRVDLARAPVAAAAVEQAGREVLTRMRRVLGVLRANRSVPLQPHPAATTVAVPT